MKEGKCVNDDCWICISHHVIDHAVLSRSSQFQWHMKTKFSFLPSLSGSHAEVPPTCVWGMRSHVTGREVVVNHRVVHFTQDVAYILLLAFHWPKQVREPSLTWREEPWKPKEKQRDGFLFPYLRILRILRHVPQKSLERCFLFLNY